MKDIRKFIIAIALGAPALAAQAAPSVLSIRDSIRDRAIVYPESFERDTRKMQDDWYLKRYAAIDDKADSQTDQAVSDEVIIRRLQAMPTVIEMPYNSVVRSYIDMYTQRRRQLVENMLGLSHYYMPVFEEALDRYDMPLELKYLPVIESALNPVAVSRAGATGLWQFMLPTATGQGHRCRRALPEATVQHLRRLVARHRRLQLRPGERQQGSTPRRRRQKGFLGHIPLPARRNQGLRACIHSRQLCDDLLSRPQHSPRAGASPAGGGLCTRQPPRAFRADFRGSGHKHGRAARTQSAVPQGRDSRTYQAIRVS